MDLRSCALRNECEYPQGAPKDGETALRVVKSLEWVSAAVVHNMARSTMEQW